MEPEDEAEAEGINSPMVGTFYRSSSPDSDPFVRVGDRVEEGTVVCILEAMKVMNEIQAETTGEIAEVLIENGEPVEFGQPLFLLR
jgi:acetyl-CoA carboxylase biotin carboxyl carrier protein